MLYVVFKLGTDRYALAASCIVEVVPLVDVKKLPNSAPGVAGIFDYRGVPVPAIDLCALATGRPALQHLSTRIMLATYADERGATHVIGLIAEGATETMRREPADFSAFGLGSGSTPYLGPVTRGARGLIQQIDLAGLLSAPIRALLLDAVPPVDGLRRQGVSLT